MFYFLPNLFGEYISFHITKIFSNGNSILCFFSYLGKIYYFVILCLMPLERNLRKGGDFQFISFSFSLLQLSLRGWRKIFLKHSTGRWRLDFFFSARLPGNWNVKIFSNNVFKIVVLEHLEITVKMGVNCVGLSR